MLAQSTQFFCLAEIEKQKIKPKAFFVVMESEWEVKPHWIYINEDSWGWNWVGGSKKKDKDRNVLIEKTQECG